MSEPPQIRWTADTILGFLRDHRDTLRSMGVEKIDVYGSYVNNTPTPQSDIDLLFTMSDLSWNRWMRVWNYLEDQLGTEIDLVPEEELREELRPSVLSEVRYVAEF